MYMNTVLITRQLKHLLNSLYLYIAFVINFSFMYTTISLGFDKFDR